MCLPPVCTLASINPGPGGTNPVVPPTHSPTQGFPDPEAIGEPLTGEVYMQHTHAWLIFNCTLLLE